MEPFSVAGHRVVVVGAARSGIAAAELLATRGAQVVLCERRDDVADDPRVRAAGVHLEIGPHRPETLAAADLVVLSPGVPPDQPAVAAARAAGVPVIGEIELASRWLKGRIVAITGTKGKSTTATLVGRMLDAAGFAVAVGGNIGVPLSGQVDASTPETLHVVEVSSFQLESTVTFHPWIAVLLNFFPDHLDRHPSVEVYGRAKARIFANQDETDWAVVNADDPQALALARHGRARQVCFATGTPLATGLTIAGDLIVHRTATGDVPLVPLSAVRLPGRHLLGDVLGAAAVGRIVGVPPEAMTRAIERFPGLEHAMEVVGEAGGLRFVNDSKATNVEAARRSIESVDGGLVVILGGRDKGGAFRDLRPALAGRARAVIAIGEARSLIGEALREVVPVQEAPSMSRAVEAAVAAAMPGDTVLLAPACASFDMFADYADRGRAFKREIARLMGAKTGSREQ